MNLRVMGTWGVFMTLLGAAVGCSTLLVWDSDGLPCDELGACVAGYSCLDERCVLWGSVTKGGACSDDVQCAEGSVCAGDRCATPCDGWFHRGSAPPATTALSILWMEGTAVIASREWDPKSARELTRRVTTTTCENTALRSTRTSLPA